VPQTTDIDRWAGDFLANQRETIAGPLAASLRFDEIEIGADGRLTLAADAYEPLLQIALREDLADKTIRVLAERVAPAPSEALPPIAFAPFSEKSAFLPIATPPVGPQGRTTAPYTLVLRLESDGRELAASAGARLLSARACEGRFAKLLQVVQAETTRVRRLAREVLQRRQIAHASGFLLDRVGRELAVPRFGERLEFRRGEILQREDRESDDKYRRRLSIYRRFAMPTRRFATEALNGTSDRPGPLQRAGAPASFEIIEKDNPFMIGMRVVGVGATPAAGAKQRENYLRYLRETILIDPKKNVPTRRQLPSAHRQRENAMRRRLRDRLVFDEADKASMAPWLARAFDRLLRTLDHLGVAGSIRIARCQDDSADSRFELGLAAEIHDLPAALVGAAQSRILNPALAASEDAEVRGVIAGFRDGARSRSDAERLLRAAGFRTVEPTAPNRQLVSHVSLGSVQVTAPLGVDAGAARDGIEIDVSLARTTGGKDAALTHALAGGPQGWPPGLDRWTPVPDAQTQTRIQNLTDPALGEQARLDAIGLRLPPNLATFRTALARYPEPQLVLLRIDDAFAAELRNGAANAIDQLEQIAETFGANGAASMVVLRSDTELVIVLSAIGLPQIGTNIGARRSSDFFWSATAISGDAVTLRGNGTKVIARAGSPGVFAVSVLAYTRIGLTDPFSWEVRLPQGDQVDLEQYELLMNLLRRLHPAGVEVNTWALRRGNVALDGARAQPLPPRLARSYRPFHRPRFAGTGDAPRRETQSERES